MAAWADRGRGAWRALKTCDRRSRPRYRTERRRFSAPRAVPAGVGGRAPAPAACAPAPRRRTPPGKIAAAHLAGSRQQGTGCSTSPSACARSAPGPAAGRRDGRRHAGGAQLRPRRLGLVAVVGLGHDRGAKAMASSPREIAVIGCGALGLTSAILAQEAGRQGHDLRQGPAARHALGPGDRQLDAGQPHRARPTPSARASRALWEQMARTSFKTLPPLPRPAGRAGGVDATATSSRPTHPPRRRRPAGRPRPAPRLRRLRATASRDLTPRGERHARRARRPSRRRASAARSS